MTIYILIGILFLLLVYIFITYNRLIKLNNEVKESFSTMDVYLKKRWDLIPNIVETVKGYAKHEKDTLESVINLRNGMYDKMSNNEKLETNEQLSTAISKLMLLAESYPGLKANESFLNLSKQLSNVENDIATARKFYNANVRDYNNKVEMFPSNVIANIFNYKIKMFFEINDAERKNVEVRL